VVVQIVSEVEQEPVVEEKAGTFYLGGTLDAGTGDRDGGLLRYDAHHLTTHGVIVGMTGSGKTGLGVVLLEEALLAGIPTLVIDPKGDMGNLLLSFPEFRADDFRPWIDEGQARRKELTVDQLAEKTARTWESGLQGWQIAADRLRRLSDSAVMDIYTPGSVAGTPLNILGSLAAPELDWNRQAETLRDEIEGFVSSLLSMAQIKANPIASPEHILLANLVETAWRAGRDLDLATLISQIVTPPIRKLGVFDLDTFFPPKERMKLAMRLNGLIASPSFATWLEGTPFSIDALLRTPDGRPRAAIVYLNHLADSERQLVVTMLMSKVITWMRQQSGTSDLRALIYMDEVFGYVPPTAEPPSKKPILTVLKQGRAFGLGMVLSTQNPVDLDYKAMSNAGTWMIGRLSTERDKARIIEGLRSASGGVDVKALDTAIGGLNKRQFVMHDNKEDGPVLFTTRWAQSYLCGPLTRDQITTLIARPAATPAEPREAAPQAATVPPPPAAPVPIPSDESPVPPATPEAVTVRYLHPAAAWAATVGATPEGTRLEAALVARVSLLFDEKKADVDHREEWEAVLHPLPADIDVTEAHHVDVDDRDFTHVCPPGARYVLPELEIGKAATFKRVAKQLKEHLYRSRQVEIFRNASLKLYARVGETQADFAARCDAVAEDGADAAVAKLRGKYAKKIDRVLDQISKAEARVRELEVAAATREQSEWVSGAGAVLSMFLGGKVRTRGLSSMASRHGTTVRARQRLATAQGKAASKSADLDDLEAALIEDVQAIRATWDERAAEITSLEIGLEKSDITVDELSLVWVPV